MKKTILPFFFILNALFLFGNKDFLSIPDSTYFNYLFQRGTSNDLFWDQDLENFDSSSHYLNKAMLLAKGVGWMDKEIEVLFQLASRQVIVNNVSALENFMQIISTKLNLHEEKLGSRFNDFKDEYNDLYVMYCFQVIHDYDEVILRTKKMIIELENKADKTETQKERLIITYSNLIAAYQLKGYYKSAKEVALKAYSFEKTQIILNYVADLSYRIKEYSESEKYYFELLEFLKAKKTPKDDGFYLSVYQELAKLYLQIDKMEDAKKMLDLAIKHKGENSLTKSITYNLLGQYHLRLGNSSKAMEYFQRSYRSDLQFYNIEKQGFRIYNHYLDFSDVYVLDEKYDTAIDTVQSAFLLLIKEFKNKTHFENPKPNNIDFPLETLSIFIKKIKIIQSKHQNFSHDKNDAKWGLATCEDAIEWMDKIFQDFNSDQDRQTFIDHSYDIFESAIYFAFALDKIELAFQFCERSRSIVLTQALKRKEAEILSITDQKMLSQKINKLKGFENEKRNPYSTYSLSAIRDSIKLLSEEIQTKRNTLYQKYPSLFHSMTKNENISISEIKNKLKKDQTLMEFFVGEKMIYTFLIDKNSFRMMEPLEYSPKLQQAISNIGDDVDNDNDEFYVENSFLIFEKLFKPVFPNEFPKRLIIVPDGNLGYVPFNILLTEKVDTSEHINFKNLPYFFKNTSISLAFSSAWRFGKKNKTKNPTINKILAYAPAFKAIPDIYAFRGTERSNVMLDTLTHTYTEIQNLKDLFNADIVLYEQATKSHFIENAGKYDFLHLATHAVVNKAESDNSFVCFSNVLDNKVVPDSLFKLTLGEIYSQDFAAKMVVLSACKTGIGRSMKGEGIISIARGFAYAGVPSIVTSLWNVDDFQTNVLMDNFYSNLDGNTEKDIAMNQAMKDYLNNPSLKERDVHPRKWAPFIVIGDTEPVEINSAFGFCYYICGTIGLLLLLFIYRRKNSQVN